MASELKCVVRNELGGGASRRLRATGKVPAVVYGQGRENLPLAVNDRETETLLRKGGRLLSLHVGEEQSPRTVLIKEIQRHPVTHRILHIDFHEIATDQAVEVAVPVKLQGKPAGLAEGGELSQMLHSITVSCLPARIPAEMAVDVSGLVIGDSILVRDLSLPEGVRAVTDGDLAVARCRHAQQVEEEEPAAAVADVASTTPEVIGREREEGEEEEAKP